MALKLNTNSPKLTEPPTGWPPGEGTLGDQRTTCCALLTDLCGLGLCEEPVKQRLRPPHNWMGKE